MLGISNFGHKKIMIYKNSDLTICGNLKGHFHTSPR